MTHICSSCPTPPSMQDRPVSSIISISSSSFQQLLETYFHRLTAKVTRNGEKLGGTNLFLCHYCFNWFLSCSDVSCLVQDSNKSLVWSLEKRCRLINGIEGLKGGLKKSCGVDQQKFLSAPIREANPLLGLAGSCLAARMSLWRRKRKFSRTAKKWNWTTQFSIFLTEWRKIQGCN